MQRFHRAVVGERATVVDGQRAATDVGADQTIVDQVVGAAHEVGLPQAAAALHHRAAAQRERAARVQRQVAVLGSVAQVDGGVVKSLRAAKADHGAGGPGDGTHVHHPR